MKKAFTLMEVNLAILVMAGGILSIVGLYSLGFRENKQSGEDVASAAYAEAVISPLVMALSATNVTWKSFSEISRPAEERQFGWGGYLQDNGTLISDPDGRARSTFSEVISAINVKGGSKFGAEWPSTYSKADWTAGLIVMHDVGSAVMRIGFRAAKQKGTILAAPLYYTEVRFQGVVENQEVAGQ